MKDRRTGILRGAIFDLDGTIIDSMPMWDKIGDEFMIQNGIAPEPDLKDTLKSMSIGQTAMYLKNACGLDREIEQVTREIEGMVESAYLYDLPLKPGVRAYLESLREEGVLVCVATASRRRLTEAALKRLGVLGLFRGVVTCQEAGAGKEERAVFDAARALLGTPAEQTVVFEDALYALKTAKAAGFKTAAVYDETFRAEWAELCALADYRIASFADRGSLPWPGFQKGICHIVGAGELFGYSISPSEGDLIVAADGGLLHTDATGLRADIVIGDFDSLDHPPESGKVIRLKKEKDDTDLYEAVRLGLYEGFREFRIYGGTGGRFDHTLANLQTLACIAGQGARGFLYGEQNVTTAISKGGIEFDGSWRGYVSAFAHGERCLGVTETGLKYALDRATLFNDRPLGVSNEFTGKSSRISVEEGTLFIVWQRGGEGGKQRVVPDIGPARG